MNERNNESREIPKIFLGTGPFHKLGNYNFKRLRTVKAVSRGIQIGYGIDCAVAYHNHFQVSNGIRLSGRKRKEFFLTTKLYNNQQNFHVETYYHNMLKELRVDYIDLLLLHWPQTGTYVNAWKQMIKLYEHKKVNYIGIANVEIRHLEHLEKEKLLLPHIIQVERNPYYTQNELLAYCKEKNILVQAYAPLGRMNEELINNKVLQRLSNKYGKTVPQIILRWHIQTNVIPVVRSIRIERIRENYEIWDFELEEEEVSEITALNRDYRINDPRKFVRYY